MAFLNCLNCINVGLQALISMILIVCYVNCYSIVRPTFLYFSLIQSIIYIVLTYTYVKLHKCVSLHYINEATADISRSIATSRTHKLYNILFVSGLLFKLANALSVLSNYTVQRSVRRGRHAEPEKALKRTSSSYLCIWLGGSMKSCGRKRYDKGQTLAGLHCANCLASNKTPAFSE